MPSCQNKGTSLAKSSSTSRARSQIQSKENVPPSNTRNDVSGDTIPLQLAETNTLLHELIAHVKKTDRRVQLLEEKLDSASSSSSSSASVTPKCRKKSVPLAVRVRVAVCNCPSHTHYSFLLDL